MENRPLKMCQQEGTGGQAKASCGFYQFFRLERSFSSEGPEKESPILRTDLSVSQK